MRVLIISILLLLTAPMFGQSKLRLYIDSVSTVISNYLEANKEHFDSTEFLSFVNDIAGHVPSAFDTISKEEVQEVSAQLIIRLMHHSEFFVGRLYEKLPEQKYWTHFRSMPPSSITREQCASFWDYHKFAYHDTDTTMVVLTLDDQYWIDHMPDSTYSKLSLHKINDQNFNICFIESNNSFKRMLSMPGDVYCYQLLEKTDHSFKLATHIKGLSSYDVFELEY